MLEGQGADVVRVRRPANAPDAVAGLLRDAELPLRVRIGEDPFIVGLPWAEAGVEVAPGAAKEEDQASVSRALAGAAETGTLFLASGMDNPSTLNFLPESHFVALAEEDVLGAYEEAWDRVRSIYGRRYMPRTVNMISGPSRTADIEQTIVRGAHGPKRLAIVRVACPQDI
jgi:L-lactate dehydrogenase complex protein LldG